MSRGRALRVLHHLEQTLLRYPPPGANEYQVRGFLVRRREDLLRELEVRLPALPSCGSCEALAAGVFFAVLRIGMETLPPDMDLPLSWEIGDLCRVEPDAPHFSIVHPTHELGRLPLCDPTTLERFILVGGRRPLVALLACSATKANTATPARDLYQGQLFRFARAWAERHADAYGVYAESEVMRTPVLRPELLQRSCLPSAPHNCSPALSKPTAPRRTT